MDELTRAYHEAYEEIYERRDDVPGYNVWVAWGDYMLRYHDETLAAFAMAAHAMQLA